MARQLDSADVFPIPGPKFGLALSWDQAASGPIDLDLQAVAFDTTGKLLDAVYYNNLKALGKGLTHSSDEMTGAKMGFDECVWASLDRLAASSVGLVVFVVACYTGARHLCDVRNGRLHVLENSPSAVVAEFALEDSSEEVDLVGALVREASGAWTFRLVQEPARDGQHFIDILEPTIGDYVRKVIPGAPRRIKACFAMEKGSVVDLPRSAHMQSVSAALGWSTEKGAIDLDVSAVMLSAAGEEVATCFFGNQAVNGFKHSGDNVTGEGDGDDEVISVNLEAIPPQVEQVFFIINIYTKGKSFAQVSDPYCRLLTHDGEEFCKYSLRDAGTENGLLMARLIREPGGARWGLQALGVPARGSMYKDALPAMRDYLARKPQEVQMTASISSASVSGMMPAHLASHQSVPVASNFSSGSAAPGGGLVPRPIRVTLIGATNLRVADMTGASDPYCIMRILGVADYKAQTERVARNLNPRWNATFDLPPVTTADILDFVVMDHDYLGTHDFLGRASLQVAVVAGGPGGAFEGELPLHDDGQHGSGLGIRGSIHVRAQVL